MSSHLETLLQRIADGVASDVEVDEARSLLEAFEGETSAAPLHEALRAESVDVADAVMSALGIGSPSVAEAVRDEAGDFDGAASIFALLDLEVGLPVGDAVRAEAGAVDVAGAVMAALDADELSLVGEAVRAEAGTIDIADAVMAALAGPAAMPSPIEAPAQPMPANNPSRWIAAVLAAALVVVVVGASGLLGSGPTTPADAVIAATGGHPLSEISLMFASASEVQIEDLSFGDDVVVFQDEGDDGALILWIDEEVL